MTEHFSEAQDVRIEFKHTDKLEEITGAVESDYDDFKEVCLLNKLIHNIFFIILTLLIVQKYLSH